MLPTCYPEQFVYCERLAARSLAQTQTFSRPLPPRLALFARTIARAAPLLVLLASRGALPVAIVDGGGSVAIVSCSTSSIPASVCGGFIMALALVEFCTQIAGGTIARVTTEVFVGAASTMANGRTGRASDGAADKAINRAILLFVYEGLQGLDLAVQALGLADSVSEGR